MLFVVALLEFLYMVTLSRFAFEFWNETAPLEYALLPKNHYIYINFCELIKLPWKIESFIVWATDDGLFGE